MRVVNDAIRLLENSVERRATHDLVVLSGAPGCCVDADEACSCDFVEPLPEDPDAGDSDAG